MTSRSVLRWLVSSAAVAIVLTGISAAARAAQSNPNSPSIAEDIDEAHASKIGQFIEAYNKNDVAALEGYIADFYSPEIFASNPNSLAIIRDRWLRAYSLIGPVELRRIDKTAEDHVEVYTRSPLTRTWLNFTFGASDTKPSYINEHSIISTTRDPDAIPAPPLNHHELADYLQDYMENLSRTDFFSGVVALVDRNGIKWWFSAGSNGKADHSTFDQNDLFDLASVSKVFVGMVAAKLATEGRVEMDQPVSAYMPDYPAHIANAVSLSDLLSHQSGIRLQENEELYAKLFRAKSWPEQFALETAAITEAYADDFARAGYYLYSNEGIDLAAAVLEAATGRSYYDLAQDYIFSPAGMTQTSVYEVNKRATYVQGWTRQKPPEADFTPGARHPNDYFVFDAGRPAGGLVSSLADMSQLASKILSGELLTQKEWRALTKPLASQSATTDFKLDYGRTMDIYQYKNGNVYGHGGGRPGASTRLDIFPDMGIALIVLSNYDYIAHRIAEHIQEILMVGRFD